MLTPNGKIHGRKRLSASAREQNTGAIEIIRELQQLDQVVQQSTAATEELASNSEQLSSQSGQLRETMALFKLEHSDFSPGGNPTPQLRERRHRISRGAALRAKDKSVQREPAGIDDGEPSAIGGIELDMGELQAVAGELVRY